MLPAAHHACGMHAGSRAVTVGRVQAVESTGTRLDDGVWHKAGISRGWRRAQGGAADKVVLSMWMTIDGVKTPPLALSGTSKLAFDTVFVAGIPGNNDMGGVTVARAQKIEGVEHLFSDSWLGYVNDKASYGAA